MLFSATEKMIAWRYLRASRRDGFFSLITGFSILGIMLGVATLILVTSLMHGITKEMQDQLIGVDGHIKILNARGGPLMDAPIITRTLTNLPEVKTIIPEITGQLMVTYQGQASGANVLAIEDTNLVHKTRLEESMSAPALQAFKDGSGVAIGEKLAQRMGVAVGDVITLISPQGRHTVGGFVPRIKQYPVVATMQFGMHMLDGSLILMPFEEAQRYFAPALGMNAAGVSALEVNIAQAGDAMLRAREVQEILGQDYRVYDWQRSNAGIFQALTVQRNVMLIILALIVLVAAFNIISSLMMLVKDKGKSIAILRALGLTRGMITRIFVLGGVKIGVIGTGMGVLLGVFAAKHLEEIKQWIESLIGQEILVGEIYFLSSLPTDTHLADVILIAGMSLGLSIFATIYPAKRAARINPAEALRYE